MTTPQQPLDPPGRAALAAAATSAPPPPRTVPNLDFDEGVTDVLCTVTIAGEQFAIPPMDAETVKFFHQIKDVDLEASDPEAVGSAIDLMRQFIVRCLLDEDQERGAAALKRSRMSLVQLMERGGALITIAAGFPTSPPSASAASSPNGGGSTTDGSSPLAVGLSPG